MPAAMTCRCGKRALSGGSLCRTCQGKADTRRAQEVADWRTPEYRRLRRQVLAEEAACWWCGRDWCESGDRWEVDHVVPRALGGSGDRSNLRKIHRTCNLQKGGKKPW